MSVSVNRQMASGAFWTLALRVTERSVGLVSIVVLARLLTPRDFGVVALAALVVGVLDLIGSFGFDAAIIQRRDIHRGHYDTAWTLQAAYGALCAVVMLVFAEPAAAFYGEPRLADVMRVFAVTVLVAGLENVGVVDFRRNLDFRRDFQFMIVKRLTGTATTLVLAFLWRNYWALVAGTLVGRVCAVIASFLLSRYRPRLALSEWRSLAAFSPWMMLTHSLMFVLSRSAEFFLGRIAGARAVGLFSLGAEISLLPTTEITSPVNRALLPGAAQIQADRGKVTHTMKRVLGLVALLAVPAGGGIVAISPTLVPFVFGDQWVEAGVVIESVAVWGVLFALISSLGTGCVATGRIRRPPIMMAVCVVVLLGGLLAWVPSQGLAGAARAYLWTAAIGGPLAMLIGLNTVGLRMLDLLAVVWRPCVAAAIMILVVGLLIGRMDGVPHAIVLAVAVGGGALTYVAVILAMWGPFSRKPSAERDLIDMALHLLRRKRER